MKSTWKQTFKIVIWAMLGAGCIALMAASIEKKNTGICSGTNINISGANGNIFIKKEDMLKVLIKYKAGNGCRLISVDLKNMEAQIKKNPWVKNAELYFDNNNTLNVKVTEKQPAARVFTLGGRSFYIDSNGMRLPTKQNATARLMIFTSFPSDNKTLSGPDSAVLQDIRKLANYINADSFWKAQVSQININNDGTYNVFTVIGNQLIKLDNADNIDEKFTRLLAFYQQVWTKAGFEKYSKIDLQYSGQIVAEKRGVINPENSVAADENLSLIIKNNQLLKDTLHSVIQTSQQTSDKKIALNEPALHLQNAVKNSALKISIKESIDNNPVLTKQPKAVMQKKTVAD